LKHRRFLALLFGRTLALFEKSGSDSRRIEGVQTKSLGKQRNNMNFIERMLGMSLIVATVCAWMSSTALAQEASAHYLSPAQSVQKRGSAPGMKVRSISSEQGTREYVVIFSQGDEAYSGLLDFAEEYHVTSGHFVAIGALSSAVLAWYDPQKKMYRENPINEQIEVASMVGDFALYQGKPALHAHMVVGHRDGTAEGGHVIEAIVSPTLEVFVTVDPVALHKKYDPATDLTLIDPESN
jgi:predicted DNA-binding protein with PD1-like motif